jgi:hypothetical protein
MTVQISVATEDGSQNTVFRTSIEVDDVDAAWRR